MRLCLPEAGQRVPQVRGPRSTTSSALCTLSAPQTSSRRCHAAQCARAFFSGTQENTHDTFLLSHKQGGIDLSLHISRAVVRANVPLQLYLFIQIGCRTLCTPRWWRCASCRSVRWSQSTTALTGWVLLWLCVHSVSGSCTCTRCCVTHTGVMRWLPGGSCTLQNTHCALSVLPKHPTHTQPPPAHNMRARCMCSYSLHHTLHLTTTTCTTDPWQPRLPVEPGSDGAGGRDGGAVCRQLCHEHQVHIHI